MRVLVAALPALGHLYPVMPLAQALRAAGHEVVIATGEPVGSRLTAAGWEVAPVEASTDAAAGQVMRSGALDFRTLPPQERWRFGVAMFAGVLAGQVAGQLGPVLDAHRPDLVVYEEMDAGAAVAAGLAGVPAVRHGIGPRLVPPMETGFADHLEALWSAAGRTPPPREDVFGQLHLDVWPAGLHTGGPEGAGGPGGTGGPVAATTPARTPLRPVAWDDSGAPLPPLLTGPRDHRERPVVYLTLGTVSTGEVAVLRSVLEGLAPLDVDVLAAVGDAIAPADRAALAATGERVHLEAFVPGAAVFGAVDAVVHHGGAGTVLGALAAGLPQLVLPQRAHDQFLSATVLARSGAGLALVPPQVSAAAVREAVTALLDQPGHREVAAGLAGQIAAMPAPADVVGALEDVAAGVRTGSPA